MANIKFEESVNRQVERLIAGGKTAMNQFLGKGILIQNSAYKRGYAVAKKEFTCECLLRCGYCNRDCRQCKLEQAYINALEQIAAGKRKPMACDYNYGAKKKYNNHGPVTIVINFHN